MGAMPNPSMRFGKITPSAVQTRIDTPVGSAKERRNPADKGPASYGTKAKRPDPSRHMGCTDTVTT